MRDGGWKLPLGALACALLWGSAFPAIKFAYRYIDAELFANRLAFAGLRFALAGMILLLFIPNVRQHYKAAPKLLLFGIALLQVFLQYTLFYWGMVLNGGIINAILNATGSFWWVLLAPLVYKTRMPSVKQLAFLALGFLGVCAAVYSPDSSGSITLLGCVVMLTSVVAATLATIMVRPLSKSVPTLFISGFSLFSGGLALAVCGIGGITTVLSQVALPFIAISLHLVFVSAVAFSLWYYLVSIYDVATLSGYRYLIPVCGVVESALLIPGEHLGKGMLLGAVLVVISVRLLDRSARVNRPKRL